MKVYAMFTIILLSHATVIGQQIIAPNDSRITIKGCSFPEMVDGKMHYFRFKPELRSMKKVKLQQDSKKGKTTSGVSLLFKTNSKKITLNFAIKAGDENRGSSFGLYINGKWQRALNFPKKMKDLELNISGDGTMSKFEVVLPNWSNPSLKNISIDEKSALEKVGKLGETYVAFGDSISHGTGQKGTYDTYPFILAKKLNKELYNVAVGGGKISQPVSEQIFEMSDIDLLTILIGYNDLNSGKSTKEYKKQYKEFVSQVRESKPFTKIVCISPLFTTNTKINKAGAKIEDYRTAVKEIVKEFKRGGDEFIYFINGPDVTSVKNLCELGVKDNVHLSIKGAAMLADELYKKIKLL